MRASSLTICRAAAQSGSESLGIVGVLAFVLIYWEVRTLGYIYVSWSCAWSLFASYSSAVHYMLKRSRIYKNLLLLYRL